MIKSFKHKGLKRFFDSGSTRGIQAAHKRKLQNILTTLNAARDIQDMSAPAFKLHELKGHEQGIWSVLVNANWRVTFRFEKGNAYIVDYSDYH